MTSISDGTPVQTTELPHIPHGAPHSPHGSLAIYLIGFGLSGLLTAIPFWLVINQGSTSSATTAILVLAFAAIQIVVQMVCFLHMSAKTEGGWSLLAMMFTLIFIVIGLVGSIWIMHHLNANMMPMSVDTMMNMP